MGSQTVKNFCYSKVTAVKLILHSRRMLTVILRRIKCNNEVTEIKLLKFSAEIYAFIKQPKN